MASWHSSPMEKVNEESCVVWIAWCNVDKGVSNHAHTPRFSCPQCTNIVVLIHSGFYIWCTGILHLLLQIWRRMWSFEHACIERERHTEWGNLTSLASCCDIVFSIDPSNPQKQAAYPDGWKHSLRAAFIAHIDFHVIIRAVGLSQRYIPALSRLKWLEELRQ